MFSLENSPITLIIRTCERTRTLKNQNVTCVAASKYHSFLSLQCTPLKQKWWVYVHEMVWFGLRYKKEVQTVSKTNHTHAHAHNSIGTWTIASTVFNVKKQCILTFSTAAVAVFPSLSLKFNWCGSLLLVIFFLCLVLRFVELDFLAKWNCVRVTVKDHIDDLFMVAVQLISRKIKCIDNRTQRSHALTCTQHNACFHPFLIQNLTIYVLPRIMQSIRIPTVKIKQKTTWRVNFLIISRALFHQESIYFLGPKKKATTTT